MEEELKRLREEAEEKEKEIGALKADLARRSAEDRVRALGIRSEFVGACVLERILADPDGADGFLSDLKEKEPGLFGTGGAPVLAGEMADGEAPGQLPFRLLRKR